MTTTKGSSSVSSEPVGGTSHYDALRRQHISDFLTKVPRSMRPVKWPAQRIREERQKRLRFLIHAAKENSPWHRERLKNIDADSVTEADLEKLPVMTKADLMANFDRIITDKRLNLQILNAHVASLRDDRYLLDNYHVIASGGTSGFRGVFVYDWDEWVKCALSYRYTYNTRRLLWRLLSFRSIGKVAVNSRMKRKNRSEEARGGMVGVFADIASHMSHALANSLFYPFINREFPATLPVPQIVDGLNSVQPDTLSAYPSMLYQLALEAKAGRLHISPKRISSGAEPLFPQIRKAVHDVWGLPVGNFWVTSEAGVMAWSCGKGEGMHLNEDMQIIEPVDESGRPVAPGVRGSKIYLTNLYNHTLPLIRYEITDQITLVDGEQCPCGSMLRRIEDIQGRLDDVFTYDRGVTVHPVVFDSAFEHFPSVVEYQVKQTEGGVDILLVTNGPVVAGDVEREVGEYLEKSGLRNPQVSAKIGERLERTPGVAKLKRFVPLTTLDRK